tara:strand:+ start:2264 stop:2443 length:180 start_codon:yes stop_codon:yes gene_type:complete
MTYQLVDNIRGVVLQEFDSKELAEKALERQSSEANVSIVEPPKKTTKKKKVANVKEEGN